MCIFCDIIDHKIPSSVVYEDDDVLAILDVSQVTEGHTLVMPKKHVANILETDEETVVKCTRVIHRLAKEIVANTGASGCNILNNCNEVAGQTVPHLHFHIIPRYSENDGIDITFHENENADLAAVLKKVKNA